MLLANISVATEIYKAFPDLAVLRSHPKPKSFMMNKTVDMLKNFGGFVFGDFFLSVFRSIIIFLSDIDLDTESSKSLAESLSQYRGTDFSTQAKFFVLMSLCSKPMELARYFCSGVFSKDEEHKFHHYALSVPLYTHFTSPIRRYPDILVHRLLDAAIKKTKPRWLSHVINKQANHCNAKKLTAKQAGEESEKLFLALFIKECGPVEVKGMVLNVSQTTLSMQRSLITECVNVTISFFPMFVGHGPRPRRTPS